MHRRWVSGDEEVMMSRTVSVVVREHFLVYTYQVKDRTEKVSRTRSPVRERTRRENRRYHRGLMLKGGRNRWGRIKRKKQL